MPAIVASMSCASIRNQNVPYRTTRRRQNIHYSLNSPSYAQEFSFEVGLLGFLGFSGQDIGIFEDHRPFHIVPLKNRSETICPAPKISNIKSTI